jgi:hypothetical protein
MTKLIRGLTQGTYECYIVSIEKTALG